MVEKTIEIDLQRPVRLDELPAMGAAFLRWWGGELREAMPTALRDALPRRKPQARVLIGATHWLILRDGADAIDFDAALADADLRTEIARKFPDSDQYRVIALIGTEQALTRRMQLPMITDVRVRPAIELQIDRLTPFKPEHIRFACRVVERRIEENNMTVDVAVVPRQAVAAIEARLEAAGIKPVAIDVAGRDGVGLGLNLRDEGQTVLQRRYRLMNSGLGVGVVVAWLMAYYAVGAAAEAEIARWQARVAELRPQAQRSADLARQIEALSQPIEIAKTRGDVTALDMLKELTRLVPDAAHLFELRINGASLEATGAAVDAPSLIAKLGASKLFAEARFRAPVTRRQGTAQDRFELALKLKDAKR